jgi:hypothetical protein
MYRLLLISLLFLTLSCRKEKEEIDLVDTPVSESELNSVPPPTFQQFIDAYEYVVKKDTALIHNEVKLTRAVFNRIKTNPNGRITSTEAIN